MTVIMEEILVERAKEGDKEAFTELYASVYQDLYRFALYTLKNKTEAEDAVSDSVVSAYENIHKLRKNKAFRSWMFRIVLNHCNKIMKKRIIFYDENMYTKKLEESGIEIDMAGNLALWEEFTKLKDNERTILSLSILGGYSSKEIAKVMNITAGSVRSIKSRTLETLRVKLG